MKKHALFLFATLLSLAASAHDFEIGGIYCYITSSTDHTVKVTYKGNNYSEYTNEYSGSISIPPAVTHDGVRYSVTSIGSRAFRDCSSLTSINIPKSVTSIGKDAFYGCSSLTDINIPEGVTSIGDDAFWGCSSLEQVTINCANVGSWFSGLSSLKKIVLGESVTSIGDDAFRGCNSLTAVRINSLEAWCNIDFASSDANPLYYAKNLYLTGSLVTKLTIPNSVTAIKNYAFYGCSSLKSINIPEGVTSIGKSAFEGCTSLTAINIPEDSKLTSIENGAFDGCSSLTAITIPESVTSIKGSAFYGCSSLTAVHISSLEVWCNIDFADSYANPLSSAKNLYLNGDLVTELTIPNSVTAIKNYAFLGCDSLTAITIPEGVTSIGDNAFRDCSSLTAITLPEGVTNIGTSAFLGCSSLTDINIPESVTSIGDHAFRDCSSLTAITIPEGVTSIGDHAFRDCSSLTAITIPESVTSIGDEAFEGCRSLKTVINYSDLPLQRGSNDYGKVACYADRVINADEVIDGYAFKTIEGVHYLTGYIGDKTEQTLPADYKGENYQIGERAFYKCSSLTAITIPESVTSIGSDAFYGCSSLTAVHISNLEVWCNIVFANSYANPLSSAKNLYLNGSLVTELTIPNSVTAIKNYAFYGWSNLTAITIPEGVTSIGSDAFSWCSSLKTVINYSDLPLQRGSYDYGRVACYADRVINVDEVIDGYAFKTIEDVNYLTGYIGDKTELTLPADYKGENYQIGDEAFYDCSSLTAINIPESVTSIGDDAFRGCSSLTAVHISSLEVWCNIDFADSYANPLSSAKNLYLNGGLVTELTIPNSVTAIKSYAFRGCSSLTAITIPEGVTSIGKSAFSGCESLTAINIPKDVTSIGEYAFRGCSSLTAITIPEGVTSIEYGTFRNCSSLTTVVLPKSVKDIYSEAFAWCPELTDVYCYAETVPTTSASAFNGSNPKYATLHVPTSAINSYKSTAPWSGFGKFETTSIAVERITLSRSSATLIEGEDLTLTVMVTPDDATDKSISWSSSNPSVATVDNTGKVTAIAPGTATITATANDGSGVSAQCEVTVTPASYVITFLVDGEVILTNTLTRGSTINLPDVPEKEGYTFSGWSEVPEIMPAKDVTVSGTFIINKYLVTFMIDDVVFASDSLEYGATITLPSTPPTREGYTFSGWGEVAETVPANDVTYSAYYIANVYKVYYFAEAKLVNMVKVTYGEPIPEYIYEPTTEGDEFLGWIGETYATMPAHDVTYTANISSDINAMSTDKGQQTIVIYDLHGRRVTNPIKGGIYIINGRKVMIK